jgi:hypothetical protein
MTGKKAAPVKRRPRRSNSLKYIDRLFSGAATAHEVTRAARFEVHSAKLNNTEGNAYGNFFKIQTVNLFLRQFGVQLIANDRVFHIYEEWPGMDRRKISGSVLLRETHEKRGSAFTPTKLFFSRGGMGAAWLDDGPAGDALRHLKALALDRGAPVALARQGARQSRSFLLETSTEYPGAAIGLGGATPEELKLATISKKNLNAQIMALRDNDRALLRECRAHERRELRLDVLIGPRVTAHEETNRYWFSRPRR